MMGNYHARCGAGEKPEVATSEAYLSLFGVVPDFKKKLATARSRGIGMSILFQNIPQLQNRYPDNQWEEILGGCDFSLFLGCNDLTTAEYFSARSGTVTVAVASLRKNFHTIRMTDYVPEYSESSSVGKRQLLNPDEVMRFPWDEGLLFIRGQKVLRVRKMDYTKHPAAKDLKLEKTSEYVPEWRKREEQKRSFDEEDFTRESAKERSGYRDQPEFSSYDSYIEKNGQEREEALSVDFEVKKPAKKGADPPAKNSGASKKRKVMKVEDLFAGADKGENSGED